MRPGTRGAIRGWLALSVGAIVGCSVDEGTVGANQPPETLLTYAGPVETVNSHLRLRWFGEDPDGTVTGYEYRWILENAVAGDWVWTAAATDSFALPAPAGTATHRFEVRAVDNDGARDPSPAVQEYGVENTPPVLAFQDPGELPTESLPAVTLAVAATDSNGNHTVATVVAWLDGQDPATDGVVSPAADGLVTLGPASFARYGQRTIFLQAFDDADSGSNIVEHTLHVIEPAGDVLLVDDMPDDIPGGTTQTDPFYLAAFDEVMGATPYTVHKIENGPFRTAAEASAILALFDRVVWYQGTNTVDGNDEPLAVATGSLVRAQAGLRQLLDRGGRVLLQTMNAFGESGAFDADFAREVLGVGEVRLNEASETPADTNFFLKTRYFTGQEPWWIAGGGPPRYVDLRVVGTFWGMELFEAAAGAETIYAIPANIVYEGQPPATVGTRQVGRGTLIYLGFPLSRCRFGSHHEEVIRSILRDELGLPGR